MSDRVRLTYAFDAYCGWCYGFGPALHEFAAADAHRIELRVLSGGLFTGSRALPTSAYPPVPKPTGASLSSPASPSVTVTGAPSPRGAR
jgi:hypothetical protein